MPWQMYESGSVMSRPYQICSTCIMDTSDPEIRFDEHGVCNHCAQYIRRVERELVSDPVVRGQRVLEIVRRIRRAGAKKEYDCILGVSGGVDSSYLAYIVKELGLRPLAVHFDNGWNSELAVDNIKKVLGKLGIDLYTYVVDWDEFCDLQKSFLKASIPNAEIPTDHAISAVLWNTAYKRGVRYIMNGSNLKTEGVMPLAWTYSSYDYLHIQAVQKRFGSKQLKSFPRLGFFKFLYYVGVVRIRTVNLLNHLDYDKKAAMQLLTEKFGWRPYTEKHYESVWTRFYQGYYLVEKFGYDKRRPHLSALINSGQISRREALERIKAKSYPDDLFNKDYDFTLKKFGLAREEFESLLKQPKKPHSAYPNLGLFYLQSSKLQEMFVRAARIK